MGQSKFYPGQSEFYPGQALVGPGVATLLLPKVSSYSYADISREKVNQLHSKRNVNLS